MLFVRYSQAEENAFLYFQELAADCRKLPREWKLLLNYHRLVWYIFSVSKEAKKLAGWQVQLITWIFTCWEWQEDMNLVIEKWKESGRKFLTSESTDPSLLTIVEHLMKEHEEATRKVKANTKGENGSKRIQKVGEAGTCVAEILNKEQTEKSNENDTENIEKAATSMKLANGVENKLDALEKSILELKREMKELKGLVSDDLKKDIKELKKQLSDELREDIKEVKEQIAKMESSKNGEKTDRENRELHENWARMKSTLEKYDVSMDGIQAFQRFRFYCIAGYLPRPSLRG